MTDARETSADMKFQRHIEMSFKICKCKTHLSSLLPDNGICQFTFSGVGTRNEFSCSCQSMNKYININK